MKDDLCTVHLHTVSSGVHIMLISPPPSPPAAPPSHARAAH
jgi:hypothetical protein